MKLDFLKITIIVFLAGLVLFGIGCGVQNSAAAGLAAEESVEDYIITDVIDLSMPDSPFLLYYRNTGEYSSLSVVEDESIAAGSIQLCATHSKYVSNLRADVAKDYYLYDENNSQMTEHRIYYLSDLSYDYTGDDRTELKDFMENLKNGVLINRSDPESVSVEIKINPSDRERLVELNDSQKIITYKEYTEEMKKKADAEKG